MKYEHTATRSVPITPTATRKVALSRSISYKFWILLAILVLASWSMFAGSVTLRWSAGNLSRFPGDIDFQVQGDFDVLEVEEMEKVVRHMWEVYTERSSSSSRRIGLPRFWRDAFKAAYEYLASDEPGVRDAAVSEIAKMSLLSVDTIEPLSAAQPTVNVDG